MVNKIYFVL